MLTGGVKKKMLFMVSMQSYSVKLKINKKGAHKTFNANVMEKSITCINSQKAFPAHRVVVLIRQRKYS